MPKRHRAVVLQLLVHPASETHDAAMLPLALQHVPECCMACRDLTLGERPCCRVQSLTKMCTDALVEVIEHVESLWGLPDAIKVGGQLA